MKANIGLYGDGDFGLFDRELGFLTPEMTQEWDNTSPWGGSKRLHTSARLSMSWGRELTTNLVHLPVGSIADDFDELKDSSGILKQQKFILTTWNSPFEQNGNEQE